MSLVNISIVGNLTKPPEQMYFASGRTKTTLVVAVNGPARQGREGNTADFYRVEAWGKLADLAGKYLAKGNQVGVTGRLVLDHWTDKQGKDRVTPVVEATQLAFPPRLKVVSDDDQTAEPAARANPIGGEIDLSEQEGAAIPDISADSAYGNTFDERLEPTPAQGGAQKSTA